MGFLALYFLLSFPATTFHQAVPYRLQKIWQPIHYNISLIPQLIPDTLTFRAETTISLEILKQTKHLLLHSLNLQISSTRLLAKAGQQVFVPIEHQYYSEKQILKIGFQDNLKPGYYDLRLKYTGELWSNNKGFFQDIYYVNNEQRIFAATNFAPTYARQTFPCWDEPGVKATFGISIRHLKDFGAVSNMPLKEQNNDPEFDGMVWSIFKTTPQMSTYNVAFAVSNFRVLTTEDLNHSIWYRMQDVDLMNNGLSSSITALTVLQQFLGIPYTLPKLDVFCVPTPGYGSSKNWGLIIIEESVLSSDNVSSDDDKFTTVSTMIDGAAHQWFGNLVTPDWWDDYWIIAGLNTYFKYFFTNQVRSFPNVESRFMQDIVFRSIRVDVVPENVPVFRKVKTPDAVISLFDSNHLRIKTAAIFHMIASMLPREIFFNGILKLLRRYQYSTVTSNDFWRTMQETMNELYPSFMRFDLKTRFMPYLSQRGYPVVYMFRNYSTGHLKLRQTCFACNFGKNLVLRGKWWVPITIATRSYPMFIDTLATHWMDPDKEELVIEGIDPEDWIIINIQSSGYYRVNYDERNWRRISDYLNSDNFSNIPPINRAKLFDDALWAVKENRGVNLNLLWDMTAYVIREVDAFPLSFIHEVCDYVIQLTNRNRQMMEAP